MCMLTGRLVHCRSLNRGCVERHLLLRDAEACKCPWTTRALFRQLKYGMLLPALPGEAALSTLAES